MREWSNERENFQLNSPEILERVARILGEHQGEYPSEWATISVPCTFKLVQETASFTKLPRQPENRSYCSQTAAYSTGVYELQILV